MTPSDRHFDHAIQAEQRDDRSEQVASYLTAFAELPVLRRRLHAVLHSLPEDAWLDFVQDESFTIRIEEYEPGKGTRMFMPMPQSVEHVSRCVVLRKKLDRAPEHFAVYIIAHELAHAFLRNGGWGIIEDKEDAADALAKHWGYPKPAIRWF